MDLIRHGVVVVVAKYRDRGDINREGVRDDNDGANVAGLTDRLNFSWVETIYIVEVGMYYVLCLFSYVCASCNE